ncbi:MAG: CHASE2 domain-containing protein [Candidatus Omnitrophica bacterium]|nr:CHASE2 domain-containing protein [Candidatus Omnitrophota bacterium]
MKTRANQRLVTSLWFILPALLLSVLSCTSWLDRYELITLDLRFKYRPPIPTSNRIVLIEIGNDTIEQLGQFPLDRRYHAVLINALHSTGASAIIFDTFFSEPHPNDDEFADAIKKAGNVYLATSFHIKEKESATTLPQAVAHRAKNLDYLALPAKGIGHINIKPDLDGKYRRIPLLIQGPEGEGSVPFLGLLAAIHDLGLNSGDLKILAGDRLQIGQQLTIPLTGGSDIFINYSGPWQQTYQHYSYVDIVRSFVAQLTGEAVRMDLSVFKDTICIVGLTADGSVDLHPNPIEPLYPSVGVHAEVINSILQNNYIDRASRAMNLFVLFSILGIASYLSLRFKPVKAFIGSLSLIVVLFIAGQLIFNSIGLWIDIILPLLGVLTAYVLCTIFKYLQQWEMNIAVESELRVARSIQQSFLPKSLPEVSGLDMAAEMITARQVGGDLYDVFRLDDRHLGVMIGDVTGKGVPASLFMAMVVGAFKTFAKSKTTPDQTLKLLNEKLTIESRAKLFVTLNYAQFDLQNKKVILANGGHLPVIHVSGDGSYTELDSLEGLPLGMIASGYDHGVTPYKTNDLFIFYTDGIIETENDQKEMYGQERLKALVKGKRYLSASEILCAIKDDYVRFKSRFSREDDITLIVIKINHD